MDSRKFLSHDDDDDDDNDDDDSDDDDSDDDDSDDSDDSDQNLHMNAWSICSKRRQFKIFNWSVGQGQSQNAIRK
jgi:hypothetical protein